MRENSLPLSEPKRRILAAAEQLFAERGFESVSVRDVTQLAKANVAAVNYHFGTREGMISLVVSHYLVPANDERLARLEALEKKWGKSIPLEEVLDAYVRPLVGIVRKSELSEAMVCKLFGRILALQGAGMPQAFEDQMRHLNDRFTRALGKSLPSLAPEELAWRMHFVVGALIHLLTHQDLLDRGPGGAPSLDAILGRFLRFSVSGLREGVELEPVVKKGPQAIFDF